MMRAIAQQSNQPTRRALSQALDPYTRRTLPIGLAVTKTALPVSVVRPPVVNRSRATAKTPRLNFASTNFIDVSMPQAYKNNRWQYYVPINRRFTIFLNTPKGNPYTFTKNGRRVDVTPAMLARKEVRANWRQTLRHRRPTYHTWTEYQKRLTKLSQRKPSRFPQIMANIDAKVQRYVQGNKQALNNVPFTLLVEWAQRNSRMASNGTPYVFNKQRKHWHRYGANSTNPLNKWNILENINLTYG